MPVLPAFAVLPSAVVTATEDGKPATAKAGGGREAASAKAGGAPENYRNEIIHFSTGPYGPTCL
ncbi:MAG: hypothetical protein JW913_17900 [Chitinispirillaceae bacterium]|nr:hypothetical protein [Chitinispirillaceae bacterium]